MSGLIKTREQAGQVIDLLQRISNESGGVSDVTREEQIDVLLEMFPLSGGSIPTEEVFTNETEIVIVHNLGYRTTIQVWDESNVLIASSIVDDGTTATVTFFSPQSGTIQYYAQ
jgi:hypothetical protein